MDLDIASFQHISSSCSNFSSNLFRALALQQKQENIVSSSFNVHILLSLLYYGSTGATKDELKSGLYLSHPDDFKGEINSLLISLHSAEKITLHMANAMYVDRNFILLQNFLDKSKYDFQTYVKKVDFRFRDDSVKQINAWIKDKTKGTISDAIGTKDIDEYTRLILINTLYFKSSWLNPFESEFTEKRKFYNINNVKTYVSTMSKTFHIPHGHIKVLNADFIKMKYLNEQFEMFIILPKKKYGLHELEKNFKWDMISRATYSTKKVELSLPKFRIETTLDLKSILKKSGINRIFDQKANFSLISERPLYVDQIRQKLFVEVDEKGSEAAAVTVAQMRARRMIVDIESFTVDHPFMFIIHHTPSNIPLFIGSIRQLGGTPNKDEL